MGSEMCIRDSTQYEGLGFSMEPENIEQYQAILLGNQKPPLVDKQQLELFAYFYFIKTIIPWNLTKQAYADNFDGFTIDSLDDLKLGKDPGRKKLDKIFSKFIGPIYQIPPFQAAVKRELRIRRIYDLEILEHNSNSVLFRVECEGGTYIRNLCDDIGSILGTKGIMEQLIRTKSGPFKLEDSFSLVEAHDIFQNWKSSSNESMMKKLLRPLEEMLVDLPKVEVKDSAVDAVCHGADLAIPGISAVSKSVKRGQLVSLVSGQSESIALGRATIDANEIIDGEPILILSILSDAI